MKNIKFYFDFLSPFSYFGWKNHKCEISNTDVSFTYHPVLMGKLFSHFEFPGPGEIKVKRDYELKCCFRYAAKNKILFSPPTKFPFNPLAIIRLATLSAAKENQFEIINCIFNAVWGQGNVLDDPELIEKILKDNNFDSNIIERSFEREAKLELKSNIKEAISKNIFGVPSFAIDEEYFWGNDSFEYLKDYLSDNDKWDKELYSSLIK